jgi:hypothetical protein
MDRLKRYKTGLLASPKEREQPSPPYNGAGWRATLQGNHKGHTAGREAIIHAASWTVAQCALDLILASLYLFNGHPPILGAESSLNAYNEFEPHFDDPDERKIYIGRFLGTQNIPIACAIAAKASRKKKWIYGITKYNFSINIHTQDFVDLEPFRAPHLGVSSFPSDHVAFSYAITAAYSALEDIGLELRASRDKPSRINGKWNPIVRDDLNNRLIKAGLNFGEPFLWTVRGPIRKIERRREIRFLYKAPWAMGLVKDCEVELADAIAYADWLRDRVASHSVKDLTRILTPYDVINVQHLARRLLLESLGFWRYLSIQKERIPTRVSGDI